jgi:hypothetical protein
MPKSYEQRLKLLVYKLFGGQNHYRLWEKSHGRYTSYACTGTNLSKNEKIEFCQLIYQACTDSFRNNIYVRANIHNKYGNIFYKSLDDVNEKNIIDIEYIKMKKSLIAYSGMERREPKLNPVDEFSGKYFFSK